MAYVKSQAILTRIREVVEESAGTLRTVPSARFLGQLPEGLAESEEARRALVKPRVHAAIIRTARAAESPPITGNLVIYDLSVEVKIIRLVTRLEQLSDTDMDALQATALEDVDVVRQALEYPGNLTQTEAGDPTDLISGLLSYVDSRIRVRREINQGAQILETIHTFSGKAIARPAT
jgi:hypothetical protein